MNDALNPEVLDGNDQRIKDMEALEKELKEFSGGLAYDQSRVIENTQNGFRQGVEGFYRAGLGLILLERHEDATTLSQVLEKYFPGISRRSAERYMQFARAASKLPNFRQFCLERGGYSKGLTMLQSCTEAEIQEFEVSGELRGFTEDEIDRMSVVTMKKALRRAKEKQEAAVKKATEKLSDENAELSQEVEALRAALVPAELAAGKKVFGRMAQKLSEACNLARKLEIKLLAADWITRLRCLQELSRVEMLVQEIQARIYEVEEPIAPRGAGMEGPSS